MNFDSFNEINRVNAPNLISSQDISEALQILIFEEIHSANLFPFKFRGRKTNDY
jgi:hypothetical protein